MASVMGCDRRERVECLFVIGTVLAFCLFALSVVIDLPPEMVRIANSYGFSFVFVMAALAIAGHARHGSRRDRGWRWIALAQLLLATSNLVYRARWSGVPEFLCRPGDVLWLLAFLPMLHGVGKLVVAWIPHRGRETTADAVLVGASMFAVSVAFISHSLAGALQLDTYDIGYNTLDLLCDLLLVSMAAAVAQAVGWRLSPAIWLLLLGAVGFAASDFLYVLRIAHGSYEEGALLDLGWPGSALLFMLSSHFDRDDEPRAEVRPSHASLVPLLMVVLVGVVLLLPVDGPLVWGFHLAAVLAIASAGVRMHVVAESALGTALALRESRVDHLTGLQNRRALTSNQEPVEGATLVIVDIDGLTEINERFGISTGDQVLIRAAERIRTCVRSSDVVIRLGDDAFGVLLRSAGMGVASRVAETIVSALEMRMVLDGRTIAVSACAGVSSQALQDTTADVLLAEAASALQMAQASGSGIVRSFVGLTGERSQERLRMRADIKDALRLGATAFVPYYQPILRIGDGEVLAVEALVRWERSDRIMLPGEFLREVEQSGSMRALTTHVMRTAMRELRTAGLDVAVTVNIPSNLLDEELFDMVDDAVLGSGSVRSQLVLEILEDAIVGNPELASQILMDLRDEGLRVFIDDFGTGWSGLSMLRDFAVDGIKIDRSFTTGMWSDSTTETIVNGVVRLADELGLLVIYEGVETDELQARFADRSEGYMQGFALARPMPIEDLQAWFEMREAESSGAELRDTDRLD